MMVELRSIRRVCLQIRKEVVFGVVGVLVRTVLCVARLFVASLRREEVELREGSVSATSSEVLSAVASLVTERQLTSKDSRRQ